MKTLTYLVRELSTKMISQLSLSKKFSFLLLNIFSQTLEVHYAPSETPLENQPWISSQHPHLLVQSIINIKELKYEKRSLKLTNICVLENVIDSGFVQIRVAFYRSKHFLQYIKVYQYHMQQFSCPSNSLCALTFDLIFINPNNVYSLREELKQKISLLTMCILLRQLMFSNLLAQNLKYRSLQCPDQIKDLNGNHVIQRCLSILSV